MLRLVAPAVAAFCGAVALSTPVGDPLRLGAWVCCGWIGTVALLREVRDGQAERGEKRARLRYYEAAYGICGVSVLVWDACVRRAGGTCSGWCRLKRRGRTHTRSRGGWPSWSSRSRTRRGRHLASSARSRCPPSPPCSRPPRDSLPARRSGQVDGWQPAIPTAAHSIIALIVRNSATLLPIASSMRGNLGAVIALVVERETKCRAVCAFARST